MSENQRSVVNVITVSTGLVPPGSFDQGLISDIAFRLPSFMFRAIAFPAHSVPLVRLGGGWKGFAEHKRADHPTSQQGMV